MVKEVISKKRKAATILRKPTIPSKRPKLQAQQLRSSDGAPRQVHVDKLHWKSINLQESLDDYEGFFGLEEIDDVEVVKDGDVISFRTRQTADPSQSEEESFDGFDDTFVAEAAPDEEEEEPQTKKSPPVAATEKKTPKSKKKKRREMEEDGELQSLNFSRLDDHDEHDEDIDVSAWNELHLSSELLLSLSRLKLVRPTPIQRAVIPEIVAGLDVIGKAATGSGKTLAYGLPIAESYLAREAMDGKPVRRVPLALVLAPTRELAHQISAHLSALQVASLSSSLKIVTITGGLSIQKQKRQLEKADVIVGTPGRLWEVINSDRSIITSFKQIKYLVIDEADRLLSDGHFKEVEEILLALERVEEDEDGDAIEDESGMDRQVLVFSATFQRDLQRKLTSRKGAAPIKKGLMSQNESLEYLLKKLPFRTDTPKFIDVDPASQMAPNLREAYVECPDAMDKDLYLYALLVLHPRTRTLIFTNSIAATRRIAPFLEQLDLPVQTLHSNMIQKARLRAIERFTKADNSILVSTDVAARGLDIPGVNLVIHYHVPRAADAYVHRSGRSARAGNKGGSILICAPSEVQAMRRLIFKVHSDRGDKSLNLKIIDLDRRVVSRIKPRVQLAKRIGDVVTAKSKQSGDKLLREGAEDLGVDYDSEELDANAIGRHGRGNMRRSKERKDRDIPKAEVASMKADLARLLKERINVGVSERYPTSGGIDMNALLNGELGLFLGNAMEIDLNMDG